MARYHTVKAKVCIMKIASYEKIIEESIKQSISTKEQLIQFSGLIAAIAEKIIQSLRNGGKVLFFGNGGSAADAQHLAAELVGRFARERQAFAAMALTTDTSIITALANDYSFSKIFARQLEGLLKKEDIVVALSTSGNSLNVLEALKVARDRGVPTIGLTGANGLKMKEAADLCLMVPSTETSRIQESHILIGHIVCDLVERELS